LIIKVNDYFVSIISLISMLFTYLISLAFITPSAFTISYLLITISLDYPSLHYFSTTLSIYVTHHSPSIPSLIIFLTLSLPIVVIIFSAQVYFVTTTTHSIHY